MENKFCIAVFTVSQKYFEQEFDLLTPKSNFRRISSKMDLCGYKFDGIILSGPWYKNDKVAEAFEILTRYIQPELIKNGK